MYKYLIILFLISGASLAQTPQLFDPGKKWIMTTSKIERNKIEFIEYDISKVDLNTMIWTFLPGGAIEYDYQSSEDVFACAGVDFLDMDVTECRWEYDASTLNVTLTIKGGYASLDDFVFKRRYFLSINDDDENYAYVLEKDLDYYFNDLRKKSRK